MVKVRRNQSLNDPEAQEKAAKKAEASKRRRAKLDVAKRFVFVSAMGLLVAVALSVGFILAQFLTLQGGERNIPFDLASIGLHTASLTVSVMVIVAVAWSMLAYYRRWRKSSSYQTSPAWLKVIFWAMLVILVALIASLGIIPLYVDSWFMRLPFMTFEVMEAAWYVLPYAFSCVSIGVGLMVFGVGLVRKERAEDSLKAAANSGPPAVEEIDDAEVDSSDVEVDETSTDAASGDVFSPASSSSLDGASPKTQPMSLASFRASNSDTVDTSSHNALSSPWDDEDESDGEDGDQGVEVEPRSQSSSSAADRLGLGDFDPPSPSEARSDESSDNDVRPAATQPPPDWIGYMV